MPNKQCGAKTRSGSRCKRWPIAGRARCGLHGGKTPIGVASPHFKHGKYSRVLPRDLRRKFEQAGRDPLFLSNQAELQLVDVCLGDFVAELNKGHGSYAFTELQKAWNDFKAAKASEDNQKVTDSVSRIDSLMKDGVSTTKLWIKIFDCIESRRRLLESESKRLKDQQQTMGLDQILSLIEFIVNTVHQAVHLYTDRDTAKKILSKVTTDIGAVVSGSVPRSAATDRLLA